jgi:hypothetical protein
VLVPQNCTSFTIPSARKTLNFLDAKVLGKCLLSLKPGSNFLFRFRDRQVLLLRKVHFSLKHTCALSKPLFRSQRFKTGSLDLMDLQPTRPYVVLRSRRQKISYSWYNLPCNISVYTSLADIMNCFGFMNELLSTSLLLSSPVLLSPTPPSQEMEGLGFEPLASSN